MSFEHLEDEEDEPMEAITEPKRKAGNAEVISIDNWRKKS